MTILAVMRHAKSDWGQPGLDDFDRPLNARGRKAAEHVGRELMHRRVRFDHVIASPAVRVRETLEGVESGYGARFDVQFERGIYDASLETLFALVRAIPANVHAPLLVGHNPGLHQLVLDLTSDDDQHYRKHVAGKFPTAAVALVDLPAVRGDETAAGSGTIVELILPRELD